MTFRPRPVPTALRGSAPDPEEHHADKITAGVPLAKLIKRKIASIPEIVMIHTPRSIAAERFRRLKTVLINEAPDAQVMAITSAGPSEGKSLTAVNLALAFAADRQGDVLLIDADMRRPTVEKWLHPAPQLGFAELLRGETSLDHAVIELENSPLKILPAGDPPGDPVELLSSTSSRTLMAELRERFFRVVIDTPPIVPFTDADAIGGVCDGVLVVARTNVTRRSAVGQAVRSVTSTQVLGTVLNGSVYNLADRSRYSEAKYYASYYEKERKE